MQFCKFECSKSVISPSLEYAECMSFVYCSHLFPKGTSEMLDLSLQAHKPEILRLTEEKLVLMWEIVIIFDKLGIILMTMRSIKVAELRRALGLRIGSWSWMISKRFISFFAILCYGFHAEDAQVSLGWGSHRKYGRCSKTWSNCHLSRPIDTASSDNGSLDLPVLPILLALVVSVAAQPPTSFHGKPCWVWFTSFHLAYSSLQNL